MAARTAVVAWMVNNQLGRRNLTPEQASYLRGKRYLEERREVGEHTGDQHTKRNGAKSSPFQLPRGKTRTTDKLADEYKVSRSTIHARLRVRPARPGWESTMKPQPLIRLEKLVDEIDDDVVEVMMALEDADGERVPADAISAAHIHIVRAKAELQKAAAVLIPPGSRGRRRAGCRR